MEGGTYCTAYPIEIETIVSATLVAFEWLLNEICKEIPFS